ncbi:hypothetical protein, partial [Geofilum rubicundum]|uniref:hypothetical protein n=1 Tax=Geofilum rubicundum TaxID=472113 RepID=UPI001D0E7092
SYYQRIDRFSSYYIKGGIVVGEFKKRVVYRDEDNSWFSRSYKMEDGSDIQALVEAGVRFYITNWCSLHLNMTVAPLTGIGGGISFHLF